MALGQAGRGDLDEPRLLQVGDGPRAAVAHRRAHPADQLAGHRGQRAAVRYLALDALGHELVLAQHVVLEVAVLGVGAATLPVPHGAERAHTAVELVLLAVDEHHLAGALLAPGEQAAEHDRVGARGDGLGDVAGVLQPAVTDHGHPGRVRGLRGLVDRGHLRDAHARHHPGGADRSRPDADLDAVRPRVDQGLRATAGGHVAADHLGVGIRLDLRDHVQHGLGVPVRGIHDQEVHSGLGQRLGATLGVLPDPDRRPDHQAAGRVLGRGGKLLALGEVLHRDQAFEAAGLVDQWQLLHLVLAQQPQRPLGRHPDRRGDQGHRGHDLGDPAAMVGLEPDIPVGDDAEQDTVGASHRDTGDPVPAAQPVHVGDRRVRPAGHRVGDHAGLGPLDHVHLLRLLLDGQVAVQHADATLAGHGDRHPGLGHGVHGRRHQRDAEPMTARDPGRGVRLAGQHRRMSREQEHIVEGQTDGRELVRLVGNTVISHGTFTGSGSGMLTS